MRDERKDRPVGGFRDGDDIFIERFGWTEFGARLKKKKEVKKDGARSKGKQD